ncbi:MAG: hypothetical protein JWL82_84 [Parcubacteria group bacterium]|nr:hypothetical protein [Parcubacteria group bacterium]
MEKFYAQALERLAAKEGADEKGLVTQLMAQLKASGRMKLLPGILRELKTIEARREKLMPAVEVASEKEGKEAMAQAKAAGIEVHEVTVNHALIKGWRARSGSTLIDRSAKRGLIDLYRKVTS